MHLPSLPAESASTRRERRTAIRQEGLDRLVSQLRGLAGSGASIEHARAVRDRYARAVVGLGPGLGGDLFVEHLLSHEAASEDAEDLDARFDALATADLDAAQAAAGALREAMRP